MRNYLSLAISFQALDYCVYVVRSYSYIIEWKIDFDPQPYGLRSPSPCPPLWLRLNSQHHHLGKDEPYKMQFTRGLVRISCSVGSIRVAPLPLRHAQVRSASILAGLSDNPGAYNRRIRRGRGPSSGKGKTSGRGHKGQKQHGKVPAGFQGGQTPLEVVKGKRGFENLYALSQKLNIYLVPARTTT